MITRSDRVSGTGAEPDLGDSGCVRVVDDRDRAPGCGAEQTDRVDPDPRRVDVGRGFDDTMAHHRRYRDTQRSGNVELLDDLRDDLRDALAVSTARA